jgi:hypothetical protein
MVALAVAASTVLFADTNRFLPPVQEKYTDVAGAGGADLIPTYNAACALVDGQNPYHSDPEKYKDPYWYSRGAEEQITYLYLPTHALVYVPIALLSGRYFPTAARMQYFFSLILIAVLGVAIADLTAAIVPIPPELRVGIGLVGMFVLALNPGNQLGMERGQSDLFTSAMCWSAAALYCRGWLRLAMFLAVGGALLKGYGAALLGGLLLIGLLSRERGDRRAVLVGFAVGLLILLAPVARYLPDAMAALSIRTRMFWRGWVNQSLYSLAYFALPSAAALMRWLVAIWSALVALVALWRLRAAWVSPGTAADTRRARALYASCFATAALTSVLSCSTNSIAYDGVLVLPGALILAATQSTHAGSGTWREHVTGAWFAVTLFWMCAFSLPRLLWRPVMPNYELPLHALGLLSLTVLILVQACSGVLLPRKSVAVR